MNKALNVKFAKQFLSVSLVILILVVALFEGPDLIKALKKVKLNWLFAGLGCYFFNYLLRAVRINIISSGRVKFWPDAVYSAFVHGFAAYIMPFRTGDLALPVLLKSVSDISLADGGKILVQARLLDFTSLGFWMLWAATLTGIPVSPLFRVLWFLAGLLMCFAPLGFKQIGGLFKTCRKGILRYLSVFETIGKVSLKSFFVSLGIWAAVGACFFCTLRSVGLPLGLGDAWLIISIQFPLQLIPVQGIANAGNHEGGWIAALALVGIPASDGLRFALTSHAVLLSYVLMLGVVALIAQKMANIKGQSGSLF